MQRYLTTLVVGGQERLNKQGTTSVNLGMTVCWIFLQQSWGSRSITISVLIFYSYSIDYDLVAFVNNVRPPFTDVLDDFQDVIFLNFDVELEDMKKTRRSLGFTLEGVDFDLLPATNVAKSQDPGWSEQDW